MAVAVSIANRASVIAEHHRYFSNALRCYETGVMMGLYAPPSDVEARSLEYMRDLLHKRHVRPPHRPLPPNR